MRKETFCLFPAFGAYFATYALCGIEAASEAMGYMSYCLTWFILHVVERKLSRYELQHSDT